MNSAAQKGLCCEVKRIQIYPSDSSEQKDLVVVDLTFRTRLIEKYHLKAEIYQDVEGAGC